MRTPMDPDTIGFLVADLSRLIRAEIDRRITRAGIDVTPAEARVLVHIRRAGRPRQNMLAETIGVEAMTVSSALDRLEARGLITREPDPDDRRAKRVAVTDAAETVLRKISEISASVRGLAAGTLTPAEWDGLLATLKQVRENLKANAGKGRAS